MGSSTHRPFRASRQVSSSDWRLALAAAKIPRATREHFTTEISRFLRYCEILEVPITYQRARSYLARIPVPPARPLAGQALRWFFHAARRVPDHGGFSHENSPPAKGGPGAPRAVGLPPSAGRAQSARPTR